MLLLNPFLVLPAGGGPVSLASVWNAADADADIVLSGADKTATITAAHGAVRSTTARNAAGNWYAHGTAGGDDGTQLIGIATGAADITHFPGFDSLGYGYYGTGAQFYNNVIGSAYGATWTAGDQIGVQLKAGELIFFKNGVSQGVAVSGLSGNFYLMWGPGTGGAGTRSFTLASSVTLPSGASAWD